MCFGWSLRFEWEIAASVIIVEWIAIVHCKTSFSPQGQHHVHVDGTLSLAILHCEPISKRDFTNQPRLEHNAATHEFVVLYRGFLVDVHRVDPIRVFSIGKCCLRCCVEIDVPIARELEACYVRVADDEVDIGV